MQDVADDDSPMTVVEHLEELRRVLIIAGGAWLLTTCVAFVFHNQLLDVIEHPIKSTLKGGGHLVNAPIVTSITDTITIPLEVSAVAGIILALPVILWQVWGFVKPGLRPTERRFAGPFLLSALLLFTLGGLFAYFVMPLGLNFLAGFISSQAVFLPDLNSYLTFFTVLILIFGVTFELPVVLVLLGLLGIVSSRQLRSKRKIIIVGIIAVSLVITPGADPFTPTALAIPLLLFFEASIVIIDRVLKR